MLVNALGSSTCAAGAAQAAAAAAASAKGSLRWPFGTADSQKY